MIRFECKRFQDLEAAELYEILHLRNAVFVVEQNCVFQDADHKDHYAFHLMAWVGNDLAGYTRLLPPGFSYSQMSIGRVVTAPQYRNKGIGKKLMERSILECRKLFGEGAIQIGAQLYLKKFYESFGFYQDGDEYLEDGIPHIHMIRQMDQNISRN